MSRIIQNTRWHRLLGKLLEELLTPLDIAVMTEVPVITEPPKADIILLRRQGAQWTENQKSWLADGLRDTSAREVLIEFKYTESLDEEAFLQTLVYDRLYSDNQKLTRNALQSFLVSAKTPNSTILDRLGFKPTALKGVYTSREPFVKVLQVILLNELADTPYNAIFKCFASRKDEQKKAFDAISDAGSFKGSDPLESLIFGLRRILMQEAIEDPEVVGWTPESVMQLGREWIESIINTTPPEKLFTSPEAAKVLERCKAEGHDMGLQKGLQKGLQEGRQEGRQKGLQEGRQEGRQKGLQEGRQEGRQEEAAAMLLKQMRRKFGQVPDQVTEKVRSADLELVEVWGENIVVANSLEDVFAS